MAKRYTIDASVFLNAFNPAEPGHAESNRFLAELRKRSDPVVVPTLLFPEIAATVSRTRQDAVLARDFANAVRGWPNLVISSLDEALSRQAVDVAAQYRLRGSDSVYVAVAVRFACTLVTLDREQLSRSASAVTTQWPIEALKDLSDDS